MKFANSPNHLGDGQNVLYADAFGAGFAGAAGVRVVGAPVDAVDSVLLPFAPEGHAPVPSRSAVTVAIAVASFLALTAVVVSFLRRRRPPGRVTSATNQT